MDREETRVRRRREGMHGERSCGDTGREMDERDAGNVRFERDAIDVYEDIEYRKTEVTR